MPVEIGQLQSEVEVLSDEMPLSEALLDRIARAVEDRLRARQRAERDRAGATAFRNGATPDEPGDAGGGRG